jgi:hypothetical protein
MRLLVFAFAFAFVPAIYADTITLRNGRAVEGTYLGGAARQVRIAVGDQIQTYDVGDILKIEFGAPAPVTEPVISAAPLAPPPQPAPADPVRPALRRNQNADDDRPTLRRAPNSQADAAILRPDASTAAPAAPLGVTLPAGTNIVVRLIDGVDSETNRVGQTFAASVDGPVAVNGETVIPRGADVVLKLVDAKASGQFTGRAELALDLVSVKVNGMTVDLNTQTVSRVSDARGNDTAKRAVGVGALGAIIGGIAGGGKGAAVGATTGAAVGAGSEVVTKGPKVRIPSETRLTFVLDTPVNL